jgi:hypothetical protein
MLNITTTYRTTATGAGRITAKGQGKQRTVSYDPALSVDANHGAALGALVNVLTDDRQQAMLRHPSGRNRVRQEGTATGAVWHIDV